jgi:hypothetical protein
MHRATRSHGGGTVLSTVTPTKDNAGLNGCAGVHIHLFLQFSHDFICEVLQLNTQRGIVDGGISSDSVEKVEAMECSPMGRSTLVD